MATKKKAKKVSKLKNYASNVHTMPAVGEEISAPHPISKARAKIIHHQPVPEQNKHVLHLELEDCPVPPPELSPTEDHISWLEWLRKIF